MPNIQEVIWESILNEFNKEIDIDFAYPTIRYYEEKSKTSQRDLAQQLGFSLGKLNYCLKALQQKGLVKIKNFEKNPNKINYIYVLTPKGVAEKTKLTDTRFGFDILAVLLGILLTFLAFNYHEYLSGVRLV